MRASVDPGNPRRTTFRLAANGSSLALEAEGAIDRRTERLRETRVALDLSRPDLLDGRLDGSPLALRLEAEGALRRPAIAWVASAPRLALRLDADRYGLDAPRIEGRIEWREDGEATAPFTLAAAAVTGLDEPVAGLLAAPVLTGRLGLADGRLLGSDLRLATPALVATGSADLVIKTGRYRVRGKAEAPRYAVPRTGTLAFATSFRIESDASGEASADGEATFRATRFDSTALLEQLGGLPAGRARWSWRAAEGTIRLFDGSLAAPRLAVRSISGSWALDSGRFTLSGAGQSAAYGPFDLVASGTPGAPRATLRAERPGLGIGLADLVVEIEPSPAGLRIVARGQTREGPAAARGLVRLANGGPLTIDLERAEVSGLEASGRLAQTPAGPFAGLLAVSGPGLDLRLALAAEGALQRIDLAGEAAQARLPLAVPIRIGAGEVRATIVLAPDGPRITGEADARNLVRAGLDLQRVTASGELRAENGSARLEANGRLGDRPVAGTLRLSTDREGYRLGIAGTVAGIPVRTLADARILVSGGVTTLRPTQVAIAGGRVDVSGRIDGTTALQLRVADVSLDLLRLAGVEAAPEGRLSGAIDLALPAGGAFPEGRAQLRVRGFTPPSLVGALPKIDLDIEALSSASGAQAALKLEGSRGSAGRLVVRLAPGPGATLAERALAGALSGGVRYFGPAETPWSFLGVPDQSLSGPIGLAADFGGTLGNPVLTGGFRAEGLTYRHLVFGTRVTDLDIQGVFDGGTIRIVRLAGQSNGGRIAGDGRIRLAAEGAGEVDLRFSLDRARLADSPSTRAIVSGPLALTGNLREVTLSGELEILEGEIRLGRLSTVASPVTDVRVRRKGAALPSATASGSTRLLYNVAVRTRDSVKVEGLGLDSFWGARFRIGGDLLDPRLSGDATLARGTFDFAGRSFEITRGRVGFAGEPLDSNVLIEASATSEGFTAGVRIAGTARRPDISFTSIPALPEDEVLARLLFGSSVADLSAPEAIQLAAAVAGLRGGTGGLDPVGRLRRASGIDRIRLTGADADTGLGAGIALGERIGRNLYVEVATDTSGNALTSLELTLTRVLSLLVQVNTLGNASANLRYARDY